MQELSGALTKLVQKSNQTRVGPDEVHKQMPNTFIDQSLRDRIMINKLRAHGINDKMRFAEIQRENSIMLEKLYRI